ncbi:MAG: Crp/Fnr family transcriptional regulator [Spirochaetales bacterium]|nr:Crp/Fnr family transcriptional regulator [Spirochaetales bacterium]
MGTTRAAYAEGEIIFREGDSGNVMYILQSGKVHIKKKVENGEKLLKVVEQEHDFFGEMSLLDGSPRSATAICTEKTNLLKIDRVSFENLILNNGRFALKIIKILSDRIRSSNIEISELVSEDMYQRVCRGMADYAKRQGEKIYTGDIKVNLADIKTYLNSSMGMSQQDIENNIYRLLRTKQIDYAPSSVKTKEDVIMSQNFIMKNSTALA